MKQSDESFYHTLLNKKIADSFFENLNVTSKAIETKIQAHPESQKFQGDLKSQRFKTTRKRSRQFSAQNRTSKNAFQVYKRYLHLLLSGELSLILQK